jgi:hypothetical protein
MKECVETGHGNRDGCHGSRGISPDVVEAFRDRATAAASATARAATLTGIGDWAFRLKRVVTQVTSIGGTFSLILEVRPSPLDLGRLAVRGSHEVRVIPQPATHPD